MSDPRHRLTPRLLAALAGLYLFALLESYWILRDYGVSLIGPAAPLPAGAPTIAVFMPMYLSCIALLLPYFHALSATRRQWALFLSGLGFLAVVLSPLFAFYCVLGMMIFYIVLRYAGRGRASLAAFAAWLLIFYTWVPAQVLVEPDPISLSFAFTFEIVMAAIFIRTFRRAAFCYYEVRIGRVGVFSLLSLLNYMIGLPFVAGHTATPSFRHFLDCQDASGEDVEATVARGMRTCLLCLACLYGFLHLRHVTFLVGPLWLPTVENYLLLDASPSRLWVMILGWHATYFLRRMGFEQFSVGAWRLFGYNLRDDFVPSALISRNVVEYWRRWNALWREFLVSWIYYPVVLSLSRRYGPRRPWIVGVAGCATILGGTIFDLLPRALFFFPRLSPIAVDFMLSLCIYHLAWGVLLGVDLFLQARGRRPGLPPIWMIPIQIAVTYTAISLCRVFEMGWPLETKLDVLKRAFGF